MRKFLIAACLCSCLTLSAEINIMAFAGSTRENSYNKKLLYNAQQIGEEEGLNIIVIDLKDYPLPLYDEDLEKNEGTPENVNVLKEILTECEAVIIASPEYNGSISGVLKNTIDWLSRRDENNSSPFKGKKIGIMSTTSGKSGGTKGLAHLRDILEHMGCQVASQEITVPSSSKAFDDQGILLDNSLKEDIRQQLNELK